jgi:hypothetical protein
VQCNVVDLKSFIPDGDIAFQVISLWFQPLNWAGKIFRQMRIDNIAAAGLLHA